MQDLARQSNNSYMRHVLTSPDIYTYQILPSKQLKGNEIYGVCAQGFPIKVQ